jgi:GGDEF domain-containing protein
MKAWGEPLTPRRRDRHVRPVRPEDLVEPDDGDPADAIQRGRAGLAALTRDLDPGDLADPAFPAKARHALATSERTKWSAIVREWAARGGNDQRPVTPWTLPDQRDLRDLLGSLAWAEALELLSELGGGRGPIAPIARSLLGRYLPVVEGEFALHVMASDPRYDLVSLWELTRLPHTLDRLWYMAAAIAFRYAALAQRAAGPVLSADGVAIASGSACLGAALWRLHIYPTLVPALLEFTLDELGADGAWADPGAEPDPLTTLVAASFVGSLDPSFDPRPTVEYFKRTQGPDGLWCLRGRPDAWLTREVLGWLETSTLPFARRFRWPGTLKVDRDRRTGLPMFGYFVDVERGINELTALSRRPIDVAFIDLAHFGDYNNAMGQAKGDEVIVAFGEMLGRVLAAQAMRDGGDEFTVLGVPGDDGPSLKVRLERFQHDWAVEFARRFGSRHVAPRIVVAEGRPAADLARTREELGVRLADAKAAHLHPPAEGVLLLI